MLRRAGGRLELARLRTEAEVAAAEFDLLARKRPNLAAEDAARTVEPIVESPPQAVHAGLSVVRFESGKQHLARLGLAVAVGVFEVDDVGRVANDGAFLPDEHVGGKLQAIAEGRRLVVAAVAVAIGQHLDAAVGSEFVVGVTIVVGHLGDPHPAVGTKVDRHRVGHQRFGGGDFDDETLLGHDGGQRCVKRRRSRPLQVAAAAFVSLAVN